MRYLDTVRWLYRGDPRIAQRYLPLARALLGQVVKRTAEAGVVSARQRFDIYDGAGTIEVIVVGLQTVAVIDVLASSPQRTSNVPPVVVTPRSDTFPDGYTGVFNQALLFPLESPDLPPWGIRWPDTDIVGFSFSAPPKGTYLGAWPDGVAAGGNIDWQGPAGERLSWYGPPSRYWWDPFDPNVFPQRYLFAEGRVLLDATAYAAAQGDSDIQGGIMGAALWRDATGVKHLHVIHKDGDVHRLVRYALGIEAIDPPLQRTVITGHTKLATLTLADSRTPWFFNASGSAAVHMTDPDTGIYNAVGTPSSCTLARLAVEPSGVAAFTTETVETIGATSDMDPQAPLAVDYQGDTEVQVGLLRGSGYFGGTGSDTILRWPWGDKTHFAFSGSGTLSGDSRPRESEDNTRNRCFILYADLRSGLLVQLRGRIFEGSDSDYREYFHVDVLRNGVRIATRLVWERGYGAPFFLSYDLYRGSYGGYFNGVSSGAPYSPRLWMHANYNSNVGTPALDFKGLLASCFTHFNNPFVASVADALDGYYDNHHYDDTRSFGWLQMAAVENDRVVWSGHLPTARNTAYSGSGTGADRTSLNFITRADLPVRTGMPDVNARFYPGWPLGSPVL